MLRLTQATHARVGETILKGMFSQIVSILNYNDSLQQSRSQDKTAYSSKPIYPNRHHYSVIVDFF